MGSTRYIIIPGFMATPIYKNDTKLSNVGSPTHPWWVRPHKFHKLNKQLFDFWGGNPYTSDKSYKAYLRLCNSVCQKISKCHKRHKHKTVLIGHSTGCNVILDKAFKMSKMHNPWGCSIELLSPGLQVYLHPVLNMIFGLRHVYGVGYVGKIALVCSRMIAAIIGNTALVPKFVGGPALALWDTRKSVVDKVQAHDFTMSVTLSQFVSYMSAYAISANYQCEGDVKRMCQYDSSVTFATHDYVTDCHAAHKLFRKTPTNIKWVSGDHESTVNKYIK